MNNEKRVPNNEVERWWNDHPFTCGVASKERNDLTGIPEHIDRAFFDRIEKKMRKWWLGATHELGEPLLSKFVPYASLKGKDVLDIAVGTGWSSIELAEHGARVVGIDITEQAISLAKKHAELKKVSTVEFRKMDAQSLQFRNESFEFVLAWGCHMHMPDTELSLREVYRVLKPRGMTVAYWYNKSSWTYWFNFMLLRGLLGGKLFAYRFDTTRLVSRYTDGSSQGGNALTKVYTPAALERMYSQAGFRSVWVRTMPLKGEVEGWPAARFPVFRFLPKSWRAWMAKQWAWGLVVVATT